MIADLLSFVMHLDVSLLAAVSNYGIWVYVILTTMVFAETGLLIFAFLPGDSLLFASGSVAAQIPETLDVRLLFILLCLASIFGNKVNYFLGRYFSDALIRRKWVHEKHLAKTRTFYEKHGGKAVIFARFLPIIRTFVPFVAGMGGMSVRLFSLYNVISALLWIGSLLGSGYFLGALPFFQKNFSLIIYGVIGVSLLPLLIALIRVKFSNSH